MNEPNRIVILGAGFGGLYAYLELHKLFHGSDDIRVTLVSDKDYFLFVPLIHEVATGTLKPRGVSQPLSVVPHCCLEKFIKAKVEAVDLDKQEVEVRNQESGISRVKFDYLISALGSCNNFFGTPGAEEHALTLKNLDDAKQIKNQIIDHFAAAAKLDNEDERRDQLRFVIVGGGPTGVELAGELADMVSHELYGAYPGLKGLAEIILVQSANKLVPPVAPWFGEQAKKILEEKGVKVLLEQRVTEVSAQGVKLKDKATEQEAALRSQTVVWTAGVKANQVELKAESQVDVDERSGRVKVNEYLQVTSYPNVFIIGDQTWVCDKEAKQPYPMRAQFAVREGQVAAINIKRSLQGKELQEFFWKDQGFILSLGKGGALAEAFGMHWAGHFAWWVYRTVYLFKLVGWRAKFATAWRWTRNLFLPRDISKL